MEYLKYINDNNLNISGKIWQRSFYDHIIRNDESLNKIREYIVFNPLTWDKDENNLMYNKTLSSKKEPMETLEEKIARVVKEEVAVVPYDPVWPEMFEQERRHLLSCLPADLIKRIEHFGSTAVPGLSAKPIVDMLVEVTSLDKTREKIPPVLEAQGYDYFWRPSWGDDIPPYYAWFIKRDKNGNRTHHIHMVETDFEHWERLLFRDYLIEHPDVAREYAGLKEKLSDTHQGDRVTYTLAKGDFIKKVTDKAIKHYRKKTE